MTKGERRPAREADRSPRERFWGPIDLGLKGEPLKRLILVLVCALLFGVAGCGGGGTTTTTTEVKTTPKPTTTEAPPPTQTSHCFSQPSSCAFPDATNTGPSGALTASDGMTLSTSGQTVENLDITGQVRISASNVTIKNSRITGTQAGGATFIVQIDSGSGTKILDTIIRGPGPGSQNAEAAVRGNALLERDEFYYCNECVQYDSLPIRDTYVHIDSILPGAHVEDIYGCSQTITVEHSTLYNAINQTATVIGDTICNGNAGNQFTVKNSLLAGGGGLLEPQVNGHFRGAETIITGNRFARCLGPTEVANNGHIFCVGHKSSDSTAAVPDEHGYFPNGGSYYVGCCFGGPLTWAGNVWDDDSATIPKP